jgi:catechol 2,3-dioxygenase-like lactoylglutathione lyase family enzyme
MSLTIHHVALSVSSLDRSLAFYHDLLGFEVVRLIDCPTEGRLGDVAALPRASARLAHLALGGQMLELLEFTHPEGRAIPPDFTLADVGFSHICLATDDIEGDYRRLREAGVRFYTPPMEYRPGVRMAYFYGPDAETCELRQSAG